MKTAMQDTSLEAYRALTPAQLAHSQRMVYTLVKAATDSGRDMTNMEISRALGWSVNRVTPRVKELRDEAHLLCLGRKRLCGVTGRRACAWRANP